MARLKQLRKLEGTIIHRSASYKKLILISKVKTFYLKGGNAHDLKPIEDGVSCAYMNEENYNVSYYGNGYFYYDYVRLFTII